MSRLYGILLIVHRSLRQHVVSTVVTVLCIALGTGLLMAVFSIKSQAHDTFTAADGGFDAVLGARGSELQLVLNSIYHLDRSPGNLPWHVYQEVAKLQAVQYAIPLAVGDNYRGFRVVGVKETLFTEHTLDERGTRLQVRQGGRLFDPDYREAVIGSYAAERLGLRVGDQFHTYHGLTFDPAAKHEDDIFLVVGVLETTNTPMDRVLWIPLEAYFRMGGHVLQGAGERYVPQAGVVIPDEHKEVSAVLLKFHSRSAGYALSQRINRQGNVATLAWPISRVVADLFERMGWAHRVLTMVAYLVVIVAAGSLLASVYNTMNERRREFAILRALGARRITLMSAIVTESATIALIGTVLGYVVYYGLLAGAAYIIRMEVGVVLAMGYWHPALFWTPIGMTLLGALAGFIPACKAYATDVAGNLVPQS